MVPNWGDGGKGMTVVLNAKYCFKGKVNMMALANCFILKTPSKFSSNTYFYLIINSNIKLDSVNDLFSVLKHYSSIKGFYSAQ